MSNYTFRFSVVENITRVGQRIGGVFDRMRVRAARFANRIDRMPRTINELEEELNQLREAQRNSFSVREIGRLGRSIRRRERELERMRRRANGVSFSLRRMASMGNLLRNVFAPLIAIMSLATVGEGIYTAQTNYERLEAVLTNSFGESSSAKRALDGLQLFAEKTPFEVDKLQDSFVKLVSRGFIPSEKELTKLGDLASSVGKSFDQLAEAQLDAETFEFERLKEFGIVARQQGDKVRISFKGVTKEISKTPDAVRQAILEFGAMEGVAGTMEAQMNTTGGLVSNIGDQMTRVYLAIGGAIKPILAVWLPQVITFFGEMAAWIEANQEGITKWIPKILKIAGIVGGFLLVFNVLTPIVAGAFTLWTTLTAIWGGTFALALSPVTLVTLGIIAIGAAIWALVKYWDQVKAFLIKIGKMLWKNHPFSWMINLIEKVFPGFKEKLSKLFSYIKAAFKLAFDWINKTFIQPISKFFKVLFSDFGKANDEAKKQGGNLGGNRGAAADRFKNRGGDLGGNRGDLAKRFADRKFAFENGLTDDFVGGLSLRLNKKDGKGGNVKAKTDKISAGGGSIKNIHINIQKLVESLNISRTSINESDAMLKEKMTKILLSVVNDTNYAL